MESLTLDLRYALRVLRANRAFTMTAIASLAIGIGATTSIFSVVSAIFLRPFAFPDAETLVDVHETSATQLCAGCGVGTSAAGFRDWRASARSFSMMAAYGERPFVVGGGDIAEQVPGALVSAALFDVLGVRPVLGRGFALDEDRAEAPRLVVLSHALWRRRFGSDRDLPGRAIRVNGEPYTVIGIMPEGFAFPAAELWVAWEPHAATGPRSERGYGVVARLATGVTVAQADAEMKRIAAALERDHPAEQSEWSASVTLLRADQSSEVGTYFMVLQGAVAFVLLIVCANLAGLMLAHATSRERELAIRAATGANRGRLVRQLLTEAMVVALAGGVLGFLGSIWAIDVARSRTSGFVPASFSIALDERVLLSCVLTTALAGFAFGLWPALRVSRPDLQDALRGSSFSHTSGRGHARLRSALVVTELALTLVLLSGAGLMIRTFLRLGTRPAGWAAPANTLLADLVLLETRYDDPGQLRTLVGDVLDRLERTTDATVAVSHTAFFAGFGGEDRRISVEGGRDVSAGGSPRFYSLVTPGFFDAQGLRLLAGRVITEEDGPGQPGVVVVNETVARSIWGSESPIGERIRFGAAGSDAPWLAVVGVVAFQDGDSGPHPPHAWLPWSQQPARPVQLIVRTPGDPFERLPSIRAALAAVNADIPLRDIRTAEADARRGLWPIRFYALTLSGLGAFAALLAAIGVWGIVAYTVNERTHEIGVRIALGATTRRVLRMVTAQVLRLAAAGLVIGLLASAALTRLIGVMLYGTSPLDPWVYSAVTLLFAVVAVLAAVLPARRATRIDPLAALRAE
jgi:putative ABC transport system permease protein